MSKGILPFLGIVAIVGKTFDNKLQRNNNSKCEGDDSYLVNVTER